MLLKIVVGGYLAVSAPAAWARINEPAPFNVDNLVRIPLLQRVRQHRRLEEQEEFLFLAP